MPFTFLLAAMLAGQAAQKDIDPGPQPEFAASVAMGEAEMRLRLIDPDSARFKWPYAFTGGTLKPRFGHTKAGWYTCGFVNAHNRMGGYTGDSWFMIMINNGQIVSLDIGEADGIDAASATCPGMIKKGLLSPAPASLGPSPARTIDFAAAANQSAAAAAAKGGIGISFAPTPFGAMIIAIAPGSSAESAGLKLGEVIESIDEKSLKGMTQAEMIAALHSGGATIALGVVGSGVVKVARPSL